MPSQTLPLALTMGDPAGIGREITALAWKKRKAEALPPFYVISDPALYDVPTAVISTPADAERFFSDALPIYPLEKSVVAELGIADDRNAEMTVHSIALGYRQLCDGEAAAIVTNPINKRVLYSTGFNYPGHTEYLAFLASDGENSAPQPVMMLASAELRTIPLTIHVPLEKVSGLITRQLIINTARIVDRDLRTYWGIDKPRLAFCGLNPHAGENGAIGREEKDIITPALSELAAEGILVSGPHPADTLFHPPVRVNYDVVVCMYHDQALIPLKMLAFDKGVNVTLGLPFVRTSPDHGTAYDIAGRGIANPNSLIEAIKLADSMAIRKAKQTV